MLNRNATACKANAHTMLELIVASTLLSLTLVPALQLMRKSLQNSQSIEAQECVATYCVSLMEEQQNAACAQWQTGTFDGTFAASGRPDLRYRAVRSDNGFDGGIPGRLMAISVTVWQDADSDGVRDPGEPSETLHAKAARMARYENEAGS